MFWARVNPAVIVLSAAAALAAGGAQDDAAREAAATAAPAQDTNTPASGDARDGERYNILFIGSSYVASAAGQDNLQKALLESQSLTVRTGNVYGPGKGAVPMWFINKGDLSPAQERRLAIIREQEAAGKEVGCSSEKHLEHLKSFKGRADKKLADGPWDHVVLGTYGSVGSPRFEECMRLWSEKCRAVNPEMKIIICSVWSSQDAPEKQPEIDRTIEKVVKENEILVAPTGRAMHAAHRARPDLHIFRTEKDSHPGIHGGYLNACVVYATITGKSPVGLPAAFEIPTSYDFKWSGKEETAKYSIDEQDAAFLQVIAWHVLASGTHGDISPQSGSQARMPRPRQPVARPQREDARAAHEDDLPVARDALDAALEPDVRRARDNR